jgi:hypothetical protein
MLQNPKLVPMDFQREREGSVLSGWNWMWRAVEFSVGILIFCLKKIELVG